MRKKAEGLSERQKEILAFIKAYMLEHQYPPTIREIGNGVGLASTSSVVAHLHALEDTGEINTPDGNGSPRAIRVAGMHYVCDEADEDK